jgi:TolB-like protein
MAEFFAELKRRHIYRVGAAYLVVAWTLAQFIDMLSQVFDLPASIARPIVILLAIGFPVALFVTWTIEAKPQQAIASAVRAKNTAVDWALFGAVAVLIALTTYQQIARPVPTAGLDAARDAALDPSGGISVAVLPFANLSSDPEQEFFSDGMTEEITSVLARVPGLTVIGRTSAFQFKGKAQDLRTIGQALNADYLIEGSVRKAGTRIRITAQLIVADSGAHLWTENYDREMTDVFAIQEDIATAIAHSFPRPLGLGPGQQLVSNRTTDADSYQQYLRGRALVRARALPDAIALLEPVVARDPDFAPAWAMLAQAHDLTPNQYALRFSDSTEGLSRVVAASSPRAETAATRAIQLDANFADGHVALAAVRDRLGKFLLADELYSKALALDPNNPEALHAHSLLLASLGRIKEALAIWQKLQALEPFVPNYTLNTAMLLWLDGQNDAAITMAKTLPATISSGVLSQIYAAAGEYSEAVDLLLQTPPGTETASLLQAATRVLRTAPAPAPSPENLPRLGIFSYVYLYVGAPSRTLELVEGELEAGYLVKATNAQFWHASYAPVRKTARFKRFVQAAGFVDYWRTKGWPDFCRPIGSDDFACT